MHTKENLLHISQLELLYKSCIHTLREQNIEIDERHERLFNTVPDHDSVELLDTIEVLHSLILAHENYDDHETVESEE